MGRIFTQESRDTILWCGRTQHRAGLGGELELGAVVGAEVRGCAVGGDLGAEHEAGGQDVDVGDFNGDGGPDFVIADSSTGSIKVVLSTP